MAYTAYDVGGNKRWMVGLSTDTKPTFSGEPLKEIGTMLMETDTGSEFKWTGAKWISVTVSGASNTHDAHVHHKPVNELVHAHTGIDKTLAVASAKQDQVLTLNNTTSLVVGDEFKLISVDDLYHETTHPSIVGIAGNDVTLDRPLDYAFAVGATLEFVVHDMGVVGSIGSTVSYQAAPGPGEIWHIQAFVLSMILSTAADDSLFGNISSLTNGMILRVYNGAVGQFGTFTNWKNNSDVKLDMLDVVYTDKAGPGLFGVTGDGAIHTRTGALPELIADNGDYVEVIVQDNLSGINTLRLKVQGHVEGR